MNRITMYTIINIVCLLIIISCAGQQKRTISLDNILTSSYQPKIKIKINSAFKLIKEGDESDQAMDFSHGVRTSNIEKEKYIFKGTQSGKIRIISIWFKRLTARRWRFGSPIFDLNNALEYGHEEIHGVRYEYAIMAYKRLVSNAESTELECVLTWLTGRTRSDILSSIGSLEVLEEGRVSLSPLEVLPATPLCFSPTIALNSIVTEHI